MKPLLGACPVSKERATQEKPDSWWVFFVVVFFKKILLLSYPNSGQKRMFVGFEVGSKLMAAHFFWGGREVLEGSGGVQMSCHLMLASWKTLPHQG